MLTSIGKAAVRRVATSTKAAYYLNPSASLSLRTALALRPAARSFTTSLPALATATTKAKKKPATATKKTTVKGRTTTAKKTTATKKKPAASKKPATKKKLVAKKKPGPKKTATKKKTTKKTAKAKPKKVGRKRKILTPEKKETLQRIEWKRTSLLGAGPKLLPVSPFNVYIAEAAKGCGPGDIGRFAQAYKDLPTVEVTRLQALANQNKNKNVQLMKAFVESHSPEEIYIANLARRHLNNKVYKKRVPQLPDARWPKRPVSPHILFMAERLKGHTGASLSAFGDLTREWKNLGEAGQKSYRDRYEKDSAHYKKQVEGLQIKVAARKKVNHDEVFKGATLAR